MPEDNNSNGINNKINIKDIMFTALNRWYLLCAVLAVCIVVALFYSYFVVTPLYSSTGKIYLTNKDSEKISTSEIAVSSYLTKDYENLITDRVVLDEVSKKLGNKYSYAELKNAVSLVNPEDTRFLEITVTTPSANDSKKIVDTICTVAQEKIIELLGIDRVAIIRNGNTPQNPSSPNIRLNLIKAVAVGILLYAAVIIAIVMFNDKITTSEDVEKYLGISVLGNIPYQNRSKAK
ncbi:MAG: Wzz/FepE/Etk N-terminal domain-containing protein [Acutalibacteraceae bacterium]|nr:Wzz/FepE/Etk N-terminal domain-containing protein [Acutalibacteraceae bacterium]